MTSSPAPRPPRWRLPLVVLAIFGAGLATGLALGPMVHRPHHPPGGPPPWLMELGLTEAQRSSARAIFERHRADIDAIVRESFPRVRARNEQMEEALKAILTPAQIERLEEVRAHRPPPPPRHGERPGPPFGEPPPSPPP